MMQEMPVRFVQVGARVVFQNREMFVSHRVISGRKANMTLVNSHGRESQRVVLDTNSRMVASNPLVIM